MPNDGPDPKVQAELTKQAVKGALALEAFCASQIAWGLTATEFSFERPARLIDELRFFLDVHCPNWRPLR